jgi:protein-disulfide isomerase
MNGSSPKGLDSLPPKTAFYAGLAGGILVVLAIGFFILLITLFRGGSLDLGGSGNGSVVDRGGNVAAAPSPNPTPSPSPSRPSAGDPPAVTDRDYVRGNPNAAITLIEYSDFECPFCQRFHPTLKQVLDNYPDDVRWVYRHFPLSIHAGAQKKAEAAECVGELGGGDAFWEFNDAIFDQQPPVSGLGSLATAVGVDAGAFQDCLDSGKHADYVRDSLNGGSGAGVTGTPGTFIVSASGESQLVPGALPYESVEQVVESFL